MREGAPTTHSTAGARLRGLICGLAVAAALVLAACERPFVDPTPPELEIVSPDLQRLFDDSTTVLRVRAASFRGIDRLERDGQPMRFDASNGTWVDTLTLDPGLNTFRVTAFDVANVEGTVEASMLRVRFNFSSDAPRLPSPWRLGEHTATLLNDRRLLLTGGVPDMVEFAHNTGFILAPGAAEFQLLPTRMVAPRTGHTAGLLPDGRVILLGGASRGSPSRLSQMVDAVEVFDPDTNRFSEIPYVGPPIQRAYHVMFVTTDTRGVVIDIQGGLGENFASTGTDLAAQRSFRTFRLTNDTLFAVGGNGVAVNGIDEAFSHTATPLDDVGSDGVGQYLVAGSFFTINTVTPINYTIDFNSSPLAIANVAPFVTDRYRHASAALPPGIVVSFGGRQSLDGVLLENSEIYIASLNRFFQFSNGPASQRRHGHTATKLPSGRILLVGGFAGGGIALSSTEYFDPGFNL